MSVDAKPSRKPWTPLHVVRLAILLALLAFGVWTLSPLVIDRRVDEEFPTAAPAAQATAAPDVQPTADAMEEPTSAAAAPAVAEPAARVEPTAVQPTAAPAGPVALFSGGFTQIDALHGASGNATIYQLPEGGLVLRLEEFNAQNGPDLRVGLSGHPMPRSSAEVHDMGYVELAGLKANQGNQNYELPADIDLSAFKSVVIYCRAFSVVFSTAELR